MHHVFQTNIHNESTKGNCMRASLASIFEIKIDDMPKFEEMEKSAWKNSFKAWLRTFNLQLIESRSEPEHDEFYIAIGNTSRGVLHCIVAKSGLDIHDPHPSQEGLLSVSKYWSFEPLAD